MNTPALHGQDKPLANMDLTALPEEIRGLIRRYGNFTPTSARAEFEQWEADFRLYLDLMEPDRAKIEALIEQFPREDADALAFRKRLSGVFNLIPMILGMYGGYLFDQEPAIDVGDDPDLLDFLDDCDGAGTGFIGFVRRKALPLAVGLGWVDVVVQNPFSRESPLTAADEARLGLKPAAIVVTPLQRVCWSCRTDGNYNWLRWRDPDHETANPFAATIVPGEAYVTVSAALRGDPLMSPDRGFWVRASRQFADPATPAGAGGEGTVPSVAWVFEGGWLPTPEVPVATLYFRESVDPRRRHFGVSKIANIAPLTKLILQIMSMTAEDVRASLAILAIPTKNGEQPKTPDGQPRVARVTSRSTIWYDREAATAPHYVQGDTSHIKIKMEWIDQIITHVLREANLLGADGSATYVGSGVQAVVMRNELFKEVSDLAAGLDVFMLDCLAGAKTWKTGKRVTRDDLKAAGVSANFFKGPYVIDPLADVVAVTEKLVDIYSRISPTMVTCALKDLARAALYQDEPNRQKVMDEIEEGSAAELQRQAENEDLMAGVGAAAPGEGGLAPEPGPGGPAGEGTP